MIELECIVIPGRQNNPWLCDRKCSALQREGVNLEFVTIIMKKSKISTVQNKVEKNL